MSRIGKKPVQIPAGVEVAVNGNNVYVKGSKGASLSSMSLRSSLSTSRTTSSPFPSRRRA